MGEESDVGIPRDLDEGPFSSHLRDLGEEPGPHRPPDPVVDVLVAAARTGDEDAFRRLWDTVRPRAHGLCVRLTGNRTDAADALQETQIAVWQHLDRFQGRCPFAAWVQAIARNAALQIVRGRGRRPEEAWHETDDLLAAPGSFADAVVDSIAVSRTMVGLPAQHREALLLWAGGLSYAQVASLMGAPVSSVRVWIHRARTRLRTDLDL